MNALSYKQPWASLIAENLKPIENRTWKCPQKYIGKRVLIHASAKPVIGLPCEALTPLQYAEVFSSGKLDALNGPTGAIIGSVIIWDCVINHSSIWAEKSEITIGALSLGIKPVYNWILTNPTKFTEPIPCKGKQSFWDYPNIIAEPEEEGGELFCHCQIPVKEENQVIGNSLFGYYCRYCGGRWYK